MPLPPSATLTIAAPNHNSIPTTTTTTTVQSLSAIFALDNQSIHANSANSTTTSAAALSASPFPPQLSADVCREIEAVLLDPIYTAITIAHILVLTGTLAEIMLLLFQHRRQRCCLHGNLMVGWLIGWHKLQTIKKQPIGKTKL